MPVLQVICEFYLRENPNSFYANVPFLYPLKTLENQSIFDVFREKRNRALA